MKNKTKARNYHYGYLDTPVGMLEIAATQDQLKHIYFVEQATHEASAADALSNSTLNRAKQQLTEYLAGERRNFDLPVAPAGSEFQKRVWQALTTIEFGATCSYSAIAKTIGNPKAVRAVGAANAKNPLTIIVPCHRVIGSNGKLTGYAGGLPRKAWLLDLEARHNTKQPGDPRLQRANNSI